MSILLPLAMVVVFGSLVFVFMFWRRLKEDYSSDILFSAGVSMAICTMLFSAIFFYIANFFFAKSAVFYPEGMWFWGAVVGYLIAYAVSVWRYEMKVYEVFDAAGIALLLWYAEIIFAYSIIPLYISGLAFFSAVFIFYLSFVWLQKNYKRLSIFRNSRAGAPGLAIIGALFFVRVLAAYFVPSLVSLVGPIDIVPSSVVAFLLFFSVYNLSEI